MIPPAKRLDDGNWRHLALVKRTGALDLYLDGVLLGTNVVTVTSWTADANGYVCFGKLFPNTVNHGHTFRGSFDRMLFYSRALNSTEIRDLHRQDSDRDGLWDITEIKSRLWRDNNNNGQQEAGEFSYISSPYYWQPPDTDSDGDGASDLIEQAAGTDIGKADTDGDLIPDGYEIEHGLDPLDPSDGALDPDSDGLTNYEEWVYNTDPNNPNSDGGNTEYPDNVNDGNEVSQGSDPNNPRDGGTAPDESEIRTIRLGVGDQSGSESEDYVVHCYRIDKETGEETRVYTFRSGGFGEYDEQDVDIFRKGESYTFQIQWQGSTLESLPASGGSPGEGADFDYTFKVEPEEDDDGILIDSYDPKTGQFRLDEPILDDDANDVTDFRERIQTRRVVLLEAETVIGEPGSEEEIPGDWVMAEAFPKPSVEMTIVSAEVVGSDLHVQVQGTVRDPVSKYAINASERPQQLKFLHQGTVLHSIPLGAGVADGVSFNETVVIANAMPVSYILRAETSPNVAGLTGFDQCAVSLTWNEDATAFPALSAPLSIYFPAAPTSGVVDEAKVYVGSGAPPGGANNMTETAADSLAFTGTLTIPATPVAISAPCEFRFALPKTFSTTTADSIVLDFRYTAPGYPQNVFYGRWLETGPNTRIFRPYGWFFGDVALKVAFTEDLPGSVATELEPATIRLPALPGQGNDPGDFRIVAGNTTYNLFKKDGYWYPKDTLKPGAPKLFLPSSLPVPTRLEAPGYDANAGKLAFKIQLDAETEVDASEIYVVPGAPPPDPGGGGGLGPLGGPPIPMSGGGEPWYPGQPVQLHQLLWAYKLLHADDTFALELLDGFLRGGHQIELGDIWGDLDLDVTLNDIFTDADNIWTIQIEEDWNPVYCARLLFEGLKRASVHAEVYSNYQFEDPFDDILAFKSALNAAVQQTRETAVFATELYLSGFGIINEGLDWILVFNDVSEGRYESLAGALPFVPAGLIKSGGSLIFRKGANEVLGTLDEAGVEALRQVTRETDLRVMGVLMDQHQFSESIRRALSANGGRINPPTDRDGLRKAMIAAAPRPKGKVVAHHDFPWSEKRWFADHGIDVNDPAFGRWVSPMEHSTWHSGAGMGPGGQFHNAWRTFIDGEDALAPYTVAEILDKLAEIRAQFPVTGGP